MNSNPLRRVIRYARPYRWVFLIAILGMTVDGMAQVAFAWMMKPLLDDTFIQRDPAMLTWLPAAIVLLFVFRGTATFLYRYGVAWVTRRTVADLRRDVFQHYLHLPMRHFDHSTTASMISRLTYDAEQLAHTGGEAATIAIRDTFTIVGLVLFLFWVSLELSIAILVVMPLIAGVVVLISKRFRKISRNVQHSMGDLTQVVEEAVAGQKIVKIFGGEAYEMARFSRANEKNRWLNLKTVATSASSNWVIQVAAACALAVIVWVAGHAAQDGGFSPGTFMQYMTGMMMILPAMKKLTGVTSLYQRGMAAAESLVGVLDMATEPDDGDLELDRARGEVAYRQVDLVYEKSSALVLRNIDLEARPGTMTALVGRSGSGKSSLVNLLPRFYLPAQGEILLDGVNIARYRLADLRRQIALVSQDVVLFNDSIAANIAYGMPEATEEQLRAAAEAANALEFIERLPQGFDTVVGDRGVLLSGGQRQRIAIARAMLKDAPILILDEATAALDTESERVIQSALERVMVNRTTFVIAHRLSTVERADQILVLDQGQIVERGTHDALLRAGGIYARLYEMQFSEA